MCEGKYTIALIILAGISFLGFSQTQQKLPIMNDTEQVQEKSLDHSKKSILARGCDPVMSLEFSKAVPPLIGNPEYVPTTSDAEFIEQLESRKWSVIFFAPGACRFSAAKQPIPGGNYQTEGWTLVEYRELIIKLQGDGVQIVETMDERETVDLLKKALANARETK